MTMIMKYRKILTIAAALVATIVISAGMQSCQGRKMSNMEPKGETVEVDIPTPVSAVENPDTTLN